MPPIDMHALSEGLLSASGIEASPFPAGFVSAPCTGRDVERVNGSSTMSQGGDVKGRILAVAARLFMEQGFAATSVREIGERAAVGQSSLYHHVRSKSQMLFELSQSFSAELLRR